MATGGRTRSVPARPHRAACPHVRTDARRSADPSPAPRRPPLHDRPRPHHRRRDLRLPHRHPLHRPRRPRTPSSSSSPPTLRSVTLDGQPLDPGGPRRATGSPSPASPPASTNCASTPTCATPAPARACTASPTPPTARPTSTPSCSWTTSSASSPPSTSPTSRPSSTLTVTAPEGWTVLANGIATHTGRRPLAGRAPPRRISTYLVAVAAGPWHSVRTEHRGLPFGLHCRRSLAPYLDTDADELLDITRACFDRYHEKFEEPYPFDSYDQAFVPEFNAGAMENPGLVTFRDEFVYRSAVTDTERQTRAMVIAHEMAHMWFGDLVTLQLVGRHLAERVLRRVHGLPDPHRSHPLHRTPGPTSASPARPGATTPTSAPPPTPSPPTSRRRHRLRAAQLRRHLLRQGRLRPAPARRLARREGLPRRHQRPLRPPPLRQRHPRRLHRLPRRRHRPRRPRLGRRLAAHHRRRHPHRPPSPTATRPAGPSTSRHDGSRPHRIAVGLYDRDLAERRHARPARPRSSTRRPAGPAPDTAHRHPPRPAPPQRRRPHLRQGPPRPRLLGHRPRAPCPASPTRSPAPSSGTPPATWSATANSPPAAYLEAARAHLPHETDLALVQGVLAFAARQIADRYLARRGPPRRPRHPHRPLPRPHPPHRGRRPPRPAPHRRTPLHRRRRRTPTPSPPGSPTAPSPAAPNSTPNCAGASSPGSPSSAPSTTTAIAAELDRDPSATGQEGAARCRAALPDPEAKTPRLGAAVRRPTTLSNYLFTATAQGFWQPEQADLVTRRTCPATTRTPSPSPPAAAPPSPPPPARCAFPAHASTPSTSASARNASRDADLMPALRRKLADQLDDLQRALRVRRG